MYFAFLGNFKTVLCDFMIFYCLTGNQKSIFLTPLDLIKWSNS